MIRNKHKKHLTIVSLILAMLCLTELTIRITDVDIKSLYSSYYVVEGDYIYNDNKELYRDSKNPKLLYELIPNAKAICRYDYSCYGLKHLNYIKPCHFYINNFGMRDLPSKIRHKKKTKGVFRIIVLGGSNTFGVSVNDGETYPARLEQYLEKIAPGKFEVWNAGLSAYVLSQVVEYAKIVTKEYEPDLLILQLANQGRRPFFYKGDLRFFFHKNKELYTENIPLVYSSNPLIQKLHNYIIQRYRTYCLIMSLINNHVFIKPTDTWQEKEQSLFCKRANTIGDTISMRDYDQFIEEYSHKVPMALIHACENDILKFSQETPHLQLAFDIMPKEYREIHPPDYVYEWYAKEIVKELLRNQLITTK